MRAPTAMVLAVAVAAFVGGAPVAHAKTDKLLPYAYDKVWPTALRFLRLDEGCALVERDVEAGYVVFDLTDEGKTFRGALELIRTRDDEGRPSVRAVLRLQDRPAYMELGMLDRLERKLRDELGEPADPPPPDKAKDKDKDKDKDKKRS